MGSRTKTKNNIYGDIYDHFQVCVSNVIYENAVVEEFCLPKRQSECVKEHTK
jgi:hypothetical protein